MVYLPSQPEHRLLRQISSPMKTPRQLVPIAAILLAACAATTTTTSSGRPAPQEQRRGNSAVVHTLGIPPGHLPPPGQCRVWIQGRQPGRQARARSCSGIAATAPTGSWIIYRPGRDNSVHVHVMDPSRPGRIYVVRHYNNNGRWLKDEDADDHAHRDTAEEANSRSSNGNGNSNGNSRRPS